MVQRQSGRLAVAFLPAAMALIIVARTPAAALCMPPMEVESTAPEAAVSHRYAWFLVESLAHARLGWQEADSAADRQHPAVKLADLKLAVEDFQCAASLVQKFQRTRASDDSTTEALQASVSGAMVAYTTFLTGFQRWATALARGDKGLPLEAAADFRVQNEKAAEFLINAAGAAWIALLKQPPDAKTPMDRLSLTRAQRAALLEGLRRRSFRAAPDTRSPDTHSPDLAAAILYKGLSNPRYKAVDDP